MAVYLTDGTTAYALAQCLMHRHRTVITGALNIAQLLAGSAGIEVIVLGGRLRATSFGSNGSLSVDSIRTLHADVAFINADGVTPGGGVRDFSLDDAASARAMSENLDRTIVLASPGKVGYEARVRVLDWARVDVLVTARMPAPFADALAGKGVSVEVVA
jgi:DeoR/GlpR family transcriptional regulator of sugar metabolism